MATTTASYDSPSHGLPLSAVLSRESNQGPGAVRAESTQVADSAGAQESTGGGGGRPAECSVGNEQCKGSTVDRQELSNEEAGSCGMPRGKY